MTKFKLTAFLLLIASQTIFGQTATEIAKTGIKSTVSLVVLDKNSQALAYGSGFIIDDETIVTNVHVIEGCNSSYVLLSGQEKKYLISGYVAIDKMNDLVILKVPGLYGEKLILGTDNFPEIGEKVYAVGNPKGLKGTFSEGIVSGIRDLTTNQVLQITAPISPGSSGGPVLNSIGQVIGIAFASFSDGQNLNFAIPVIYLKALKLKVSTVVPLATVKSQPKTVSTATTSPNIKEGITVRNIDPCFANTRGSAHRSCSSPRVSFSVKNNLGHMINSVHVLLLVYDKTGIVIGYNEETFWEWDNEGIKPFLARSVEMEMEGSGDDLSNIYAEDAYVNIRILNFKLVEE